VSQEKHFQRITTKCERFIVADTLSKQQGYDPNKFLSLSGRTESSFATNAAFKASVKTTIGTLLLANWIEKSIRPTCFARNKSNTLCQTTQERFTPAKHHKIC